MPPDELGRMPISDAMKSRISDTLRAIPPGKKGALLVLADEHGARAQLAACINGGWKVAAGVGFEWHEPKPSGYVALSGAW